MPCFEFVAFVRLLSVIVHTLGDFLLRLLLSQVAEPKFGLNTDLRQKVKCVRWAETSV